MDGSSIFDASAMQAVLAKQKAAHLRDGAPSAEKRIERIDRCLHLLFHNHTPIQAALASDYGVRSPMATAFVDMGGSTGPLMYARARLRKWMRPQKRSAGALQSLMGARAEIRFQPKGVVGVISPWNYPVHLIFSPLAGVLAAGNRAMIKPSEFTPATSELMAAMFANAFSDEEIAVVTGGPDVGQAFAGLAFDHLVFTGTTSVARHVMRAAADNLVPLTLELGGKSPVIVGSSANLDVAAARILAGKMMNAGQVCLAPDYVLAPSETLERFVAVAESTLRSMYPTMKDNPDYTALINQRQFDRVTGYIDEARAKGARVIQVKPDGEDFSQQEHRRIPPTLIIDPGDDLTVMREEIFGPVLPIKSYGSIDEAIAYVNARDRPLGLYYFGADEAERERVLAATTSGGVTINDVTSHGAQEDLPFGGVGPAGMGCYHGQDGFREFSHKKAVFRQINAELGIFKQMRPPYGPGIRKHFDGQI